MRRLFTIFALLVCPIFLPRLRAQQQPGYEIEALNDQGWGEYDFRTGMAIGTNGVRVKYGGSVMTSERVAVNQGTGEAIADGKVRIQREEQIWVGEHMRYNFKTREMEAEQFRTGKAPVFIAGEGLHAELTNQVYLATNAFVATDDVAEPAFRIRAKRIRIVPGDKVVAYDATLYAGSIPIFYFPIYSRSLALEGNNFEFTPGYRSTFGPFLLTTYNWHYNQVLNGALHLDYRQRRGVGVGPDFNVELGRWGTASLEYYYAHDEDPNAGVTTTPAGDNRQRVHFAYDARPWTNVNVKSVVRFETDNRVVKDFFEGEYRQNIQPSTFLEVNRFWQNFSLDVYAQPRVNDFLETVERLPDVRLTGFRQQIGQLPLYYESESSAGYYRRLFADTNGPPIGLDYSAARADTYHQVVAPFTLFGWLNLMPRVGGRFTYYSEASGPGATSQEIYRGVFNTGAEVSFKASRLWPGYQSKFLDMDGLRHIIQPSINYVYVPAPNHRPPELPQFDYELQSLRLLPIEFPDYNAIDAIDSQNVIRFGLQNKIQTKRAGAIVNVVDWNVYTDWRLRPLPGQTTFADLYSDLVFKPRKWLTWESLERYDLDDKEFRLALNTVTIQPNDVWSWSLGHYYLRDDPRPPPLGLGEGNNLLMSSLFYRLNEDWGFRMTHNFEARDGRMEEQYYTVYRDLRSWTAALTFRVRDSGVGAEDFTVAFTFSLKAHPRFGLGRDTLRPYSLLGG
jgi:LPS-assembly protein